MSRQPSPILAYQPETRRAYLFAGQSDAARWLLDTGRATGALNTVRSNLRLVSHPDLPGIRHLHGFAWVRGGPEIGPLMDTLIRRLRVSALNAVQWGSLTDAELVRAMAAARVMDPAAEASRTSPLAAGIRLLDAPPA